jgi:hypothetical protein
MFYHHLVGSRMRSLIKVLKTTYDEYRTTTYDPCRQDYPGQTNLRLPKMRVSSWKKNIKISPMDYKPFKDEASWIRFKERFITTIESHGLDHLIDTNYVASLDSIRSNVDGSTRSSKIPFKPC